MIYKFFTDKFGWIQISVENEEDARKVMARFPDARDLEALPKDPDTITVEIEDSLQSRLDDCIEAAIEELDDYIERNEGELPNQLPDEVVDNVYERVQNYVPIDYKEIKGLWYLHWGKLEDAYEEAHVGDNPISGNGQHAIYHYLEQETLAALEKYLEDKIKGLA